MAGIYIHIPFCKQACVYCNFHFSTSLKLKDRLIDAIIAEVHIRKDYLKTKNIQSIYFGGGTPSILHAEDIGRILEALSIYFSWNSTCEITLEANPDDITTDKVKSYIHLGINRLSLGIQSFYDDDLRFMTRAHNSQQAESSIRVIQDAGINNMTIDLIYGCPTTTNDMWSGNLEKFRSFDIPHLSSYCLTVEQKTALHHMVKSGKTEMPHETRAIEQFEILMDFAESTGFDHYEISNFAKKGFIATHNSNYWMSVPYIGIGPSAHSFDGHSRSWNIANNPSYINLVSNNEIFNETEVLTAEEKYNEYIMTRIRTQWGVNVEELAEYHGDTAMRHFIREIRKPLLNAWVSDVKNTYILTKTGKLFADRIAAELFMDVR
jgi:oxygen-independent coproporphyrinogen III oxidase